jgi:hypothetical protein
MIPVAERARFAVLLIEKGLHDDVVEAFEALIQDIDEEGLPTIPSMVQFAHGKISETLSELGRNYELAAKGCADHTLARELVETARLDAHKLSLLSMLLLGLSSMLSALPDQVLFGPKNNETPEAG